MTDHLQAANLLISGQKCLNEALNGVKVLGETETESTLSEHIGNTENICPILTRAQINQIISQQDCYLFNLIVRMRHLLPTIPVFFLEQLGLGLNCLWCRIFRDRVGLQVTSCQQAVGFYKKRYYLQYFLC